MRWTVPGSRFAGVAAKGRIPFQRHASYRLLKGDEMDKYRTCFILGLFATVLILSTVAASHASQESVIIGRLFGSTQPLPDFFRGNVNLNANNIEPEFLGFRFVNSQSGKKIKMRPDSLGYFSKSLEPGTWTFERFRTDRPNTDDPKVIEIMTFDVPPGSLVNLGTIIIVVDGKPTERLHIRKNWEEGTFVYTYNYFRSDSAEDNAWPLENLKRKKPKTLEKYKDRIVEITDPVTTDADSSRVKLRARKAW